MNRITMAKIALAIAGIVVFGYGVSQDNQRARLAGIIIVGVGVVLRFFGSRRGRDRDEGMKE